MILIDSKGLFTGDRIAQLSDEAKLMWPWLFLASNGYGRLEIHYRKLLSQVFSGFRKPPTEEQLMGFVREYADNFLLFVYKTDKGQLWGQWDCSAKHLPRYATAADRSSPNPPIEDFNRWKDAYIASKSTQVSVVPTFSEIFGKISNVSEDYREVLPQATQQNSSKTDQVPVPATISENLEKFPRSVAVAVAVAEANKSCTVTESATAKPPASESVFSKTSTEEPQPRLVPPMETSKRWNEFREKATSVGITGTEVDWTAAYEEAWKKLPIEERIKAFKALQDRTLPPRKQFYTRPLKWLKDQPWARIEPEPESIYAGMPIIRAGDIPKDYDWKYTVPITGTDG